MFSGRRCCCTFLVILFRPAHPTSYNEAEARMYMQYARASFCDEQRVEAWDCGDMCADAPVVPGFVRHLNRTWYWECEGYVARLPPNDPSDVHCVAAFRGSVDIANWLADFAFEQVQWPNWPADPGLCANCSVHAGVADVYRELRSLLLPTIRELGCHRLSMAGHSLGGALATLASHDVRRTLGLRVEPVYTFGKLRTGDRAFVEEYIAAAAEQGVEPPMWRVVDKYDPVPRLPFQTVLDFHHEPLEVYYHTAANDAFWVCPAEAGHLENASCSAATSLLMCVANNPGVQHNSYMNETTLGYKLPEACVSENAGDGPNTLGDNVIRFLPFGVLFLCVATLALIGRCRRQGDEFSDEEATSILTSDSVQLCAREVSLKQGA